MKSSGRNCQKQDVKPSPRTEAHASSTLIFCTETVSYKPHSQWIGRKNWLQSPLLSCHPVSSRNWFSHHYVRSIVNLLSRQNERETRSRHFPAQIPLGKFISLNGKSQHSRHGPQTFRGLWALTLSPCSLLLGVLLQPSWLLRGSSIKPGLLPT